MVRSKGPSIQEGQQIDSRSLANGNSETERMGFIITQNLVGDPVSVKVVYIKPGKTKSQILLEASRDTGADTWQRQQACCHSGLWPAGGDEEGQPSQWLLMKEDERVTPSCQHLGLLYVFVACRLHLSS